jgi:hypothetical protein
MNDTGSGLLHLYDTDLTAMGINRNNYTAWGQPVRLWTASGVTQKQTLFVEVQLQRREQGGVVTPVADWFREHSSVSTPSSSRNYILSGLGMRNHFFFATSPGNNTLYVAQKKNGLMSMLPVA